MTNVTDLLLASAVIISFVAILNYSFYLWLRKDVVKIANNLESLGVESRKRRSGFEKDWQSLIQMRDNQWK